MTKNWLIVEKIIATFEIAISCLLMYSLYISLSSYVNMVLESQNNIGDNISKLFFFKVYHLGFLSALLTLFSGCFLLLGKKIGWITSVAAISVMILNGITTTIFNKNNDVNVYIACLLLCVLITIFSLLLFKPFKEKYDAVKIALITVAVIDALFLADKLFI